MCINKEQEHRQKAMLILMSRGEQVSQNMGIVAGKWLVSWTYCSLEIVYMELDGIFCGF